MWVSLLDTMNLQFKVQQWHLNGNTTIRTNTRALVKTLERLNARVFVHLKCSYIPKHSQSMECPRHCHHQHLHRRQCHRRHHRHRHTRNWYSMAVTMDADNMESLASNTTFVVMVEEIHSYHKFAIMDRK
jgi:hypothetical protein